MKATALRLENGKFMRGNTEVPAEIGNREQIELLQRIERNAAKNEKAALDGRLEVDIYAEDIRYRTVCEFECVCSNKIRETAIDYTDDWEELEDPEWDNGRITCPVCGRVYDIEGGYARLR